MTSPPHCSRVQHRTSASHTALYQLCLDLQHLHKLLKVSTAPSEGWDLRFEGMKD